MITYFLNNESMGRVKPYETISNKAKKCKSDFPD